MTDHDSSDALPHEDDAPLTLDAPGSVVVVGGGALGIEAALYGRFLGYDVTVLEATAVGGCLNDQRDQPLPMLPGRCLSPLAMAALGAQAGDTVPTALPTTVEQWIEEALVPLTQSDLLHGRVHVGAHVTRIDTVAIEPDEADEDISDIPPDFRLSLSGKSELPATIDAEAVILAIGSSGEIELGFELPADYFFRIGRQRSGNVERDLQAGLKEIVEIFAGLGGRADLDLYRPRRG